MLGNGGFAGTIDKTNMAQQLEKGFAVAGQVVSNNAQRHYVNFQQRRLRP